MEQLAQRRKHLRWALIVVIAAEALIQLWVHGLLQTTVGRLPFGVILVVLLVFFLYT